MIKFRLTNVQLLVIDPLLVQAKNAADKDAPGMIFIQTDSAGFAKAEFIDHDTAVAIVAAKAGLSKPKKADREKIILDWHAGREV